MEQLCHPEFTQYIITREGNCFSKNKNKWLKPSFNSCGYLRFYVSGKHRFAHRLVAETYITNYNNLKCIDHIDINKENNNVNNLRWINHSNNNLNRKQNKNNKLGIKNISETREGKFLFTKTVQGKKYSKWFKTLEEAETHKIDWHILNDIILH